MRLKIGFVVHILIVVDLFAFGFRFVVDLLVGVVKLFVFGF